MNNSDAVSPEILQNAEFVTLTILPPRKVRIKRALKAGFRTGAIAGVAVVVVGTIAQHVLRENLTED